MLTLLSFSALTLPVVLAQKYSATYLPSTLPNQTETGESGYNICGKGHDQNSMCQTAYVNSIEDFCLWAPPTPGPDSVIGNTERIEVAWCTKPGYGTRLIPDGTITGVHFVQTPDYIQLTGVGDLTKLNIPAGDTGGELDPHGADGNGNPIGGIVFTNAFGTIVQSHEWSSFIGAEQFCFRVCKDGPNAWQYCNHIYDVMGCAWNYPGDYSAGLFDTCKAASGEFPGVNSGTTFHQGDPVTPPAHPAPPKSDCTTISSLSANGVSTSMSTSTTSTSSSTRTSTATTGTATSLPAPTGGSSPNNNSGAVSIHGSLIMIFGIFAGLIVIF